jgi:hypothetical protein
MCASLSSTATRASKRCCEIQPQLSYTRQEEQQFQPQKWTRQCVKTEAPSKAHLRETYLLKTTYLLSRWSKIKMEGDNCEAYVHYKRWISLQWFLQWFCKPHKISCNTFAMVFIEICSAFAMILQYQHELIIYNHSLQHSTRDSGSS